MDDTRNALVARFGDHILGLYPKVVMMENVPDLKGHELFAGLETRLADSGYEWQRSAVRDVADYGVPQRRRRLILVASRVGRVRLARRNKRRVTVAAAIAGLPKAGDSGDPLHDFPERRSPRIAKLIRRIPKNGGSRTDLGLEWQLQCHIRSNGFRDVYGRMAWDRVAPTITSGCVNPSKGRFLHPEENRAITLREAMILQGFNPSYDLSLRRGKFAAAAMIGNALPPEFARRHAVAIKRTLERAEDDDRRRSCRT